MSLSARERGGWSARWLSGSTWARTGGGSGCRATRWIGGSARIVRAGSTRWSRRRGGSRTGTPERLLELAVALRREQPARTAAQIHRIIVEAEGCGAVGAHDPASLRGGRAAVEGRPGRAGARAVRGGATQRVVDRGRVARPVDRRSPHVPVLLHRRSQPAAGRLSVGGAGGRAERLPGVARGDRRARPAEGRLRRQRQPVRVRPAAARVRGARDPADPLHGRDGRRGAGRSNGSFGRSANRCWSSSRTARPRAWRTSTGSFRRGLSRSTTAACTPRPGRRRWSGSSPRARRRSPTERGADARRSAGRSGGRCPRPGRVGMHGNTYEVDAELAGRRSSWSSTRSS